MLNAILKIAAIGAIVIWALSSLTIVGTYTEWLDKLMPSTTNKSNQRQN